MNEAAERWVTWGLWGIGATGLVRLGLWWLGPSESLVVRALDLAATGVLIVSLTGLGVWVLRGMQRHLLWRVRRKLILSYVFIGFIPVVLLGMFLLLVGSLTLVATSSYLVSMSLDGLVGEAHVAAEAAASGENGRFRDLGRQREALRRRHPGAVVEAIRGATPAWLAEDSFAGLVRESDGEGGVLTVRALVFSAGGGVLVDLPLDRPTLDRLFQDTGVRLTPDQAGTPESDARGAPAGSELIIPGFSIVQPTNWVTGDREYSNLETTVAPGIFYERVFGTQVGIGDVELGAFFLLALASVAGMFLIIEVTALIMGFSLAHSITGAVHQLFRGTEHVRRGDLDHTIVVESNDQLGELADSFNAMTGSIRDLLKQAEEKKRLEEELRIARRIQMSLLPTDVATVEGATVAAICVPAREVGGDYYDFIRLGERQLAIVVADVSGKGTSAAFYMAELKGLILSLSRIHDSPRQLLIEANRIITPHIDSRSFITMMYAILDLDAGTLTYARAGHTPLIYLRCDGLAPKARHLAPSGLVVGLDGFEKKFEELIEEQTLDVQKGDLAVFYTDGISEAMNPDADLFGEERLGALIEGHAILPPADLRRCIVDRVTDFADGAEQHDDMTLVLCKIERGGLEPTTEGPDVRVS